MTYFTEKNHKRFQLHGDRPGQVFEVCFTRDSEKEDFLEKTHLISEYVISTRHEGVVYLQGINENVSAKIIKELSTRAKIIAIETGYNNDPRAMLRSREGF